MAIQPTPAPTASSKAIILTEMVILLGSTIAIHRSRGEAWVDIWTKTAVRAALGTVVLLIILLTADDLGAGSVGAMFGGLIVIGYLLTAFGVLGPALVQLEQIYLGAPPPTTTTSQTGSVTSTH